MSRPLWGVYYSGVMVTHLQSKSPATGNQVATRTLTITITERERELLYLALAGAAHDHADAYMQQETGTTPAEYHTLAKKCGFKVRKNEIESR